MSLMQPGRPAMIASGPTTPSVVPAPQAGCPARTAAPTVPCSSPAGNSTPWHAQTAASPSETDAHPRSESTAGSWPSPMPLPSPPMPPDSQGRVPRASPVASQPAFPSPAPGSFPSTVHAGWHCVLSLAVPHSYLGYYQLHPTNLKPAGFRTQQ